jgi:aminoglycoside phosphotransferase (APT) family kinase protein
MTETALTTHQMLERLTPWLQARTPGAEGMQLLDAREPKQGYANITILFRAAWRQDGAPRERRLVARIQRESDCPLLQNVLQQWQVMEAVAANSDVLVPRLVVAEADPAVLGAPFFLMEQVEGRVPSDFPSHHAEGWFEELTPDQRGQTWWNGIREMSRLHQISWRAYPFLSEGLKQTPSVGFYLQASVGRWYDWAADGRKYPVVDEAFRRLMDRQPATSQAGLVWNDARMGNTMFAQDLTVASLFDFDTASLGPAEIDLAWWLHMEDLFATGFGPGRLAGVPNRDDAIQGFERIYGRPMVDFEYFEAVSALRHAVISIRSYGNGKIDDPDDSTGFGWATQRLKAYLSRVAA